jgi:hypothetical protein
MGSLVVIHGTGVRAAAYDATFEVASAKVRLARGETLKPARCYWGDAGANLPKDPLCLPREIDYRGVGLVKSDISAEDWAVLYDDPMRELEQLPVTGAGRGKSEIQELAGHIRTVAASAALVEALDEIAASAEWEPARTTVVNDAAFLPAVQRAPSDSTRFRATVARAIVAEMTRRLLSAARPVPDDELRGAWLNLIVDLLRPSGEPATMLDSRGVGEVKQRVAGALGWGAQWLAAGFVERKRMVESETIGAVVGDIVRYQAPRGGDAIREIVVKSIRGAEKPRYILAHSLGSVAAVDTLVLEKDLEVERLITIGSPAGVFYELNALYSLSNADRLPEHFPKWTNIYDPRDLISYIAHRTFHYDDRISDVPHESGQPLAAAHSAYWASRRAWASIWKVIP